MQVSVTERGTYKRCRRRWDLGSENRQSLQSINGGSAALELGSLIHKALAQWILEPDGDPSDFFMTFAQQRLEEIEDTIEVYAKRTSTDEDTENLIESVELGQAMMANYKRFYKKPIPDNMVFAAAEQSIAVPVPGTEHQCPKCLEQAKLDPHSEITTVVRYEEYFGRLGHIIVWGDCPDCGGTGIAYHWLTGTLDGLIKSDKDELFVLEHKTYSRRPDVQALHTNDQFTAYMWMLRELNLGKVGGVAYDGMWKRGSVPKGKTFADLFLRRPIRKAATELNEFGLMLADELNEMARPDLALYTNRRWEGCSDCGFESLCTAMSKGDDVDFIREKYYMPRGDNKVRGVRSESASVVALPVIG